MRNGKMQHTTRQVKIDDFARSGVLTTEGIAATIGMVLAVTVNPAIGLLIFALAIAAKKVGEEAIYGSITDLGEGTRLQQVYIGDGVYFVSGQTGIAKIAATMLAKIIDGFTRLLDQSNGASRTRSIYFTRVDDQIVALVATAKDGPYTNLADLGFTSVVPLAVLGGFIGFRANDTGNQANRRIYFLPFAEARRGNWAVENWKASEPLPAMVKAILRMPLRLTAQNTHDVALTIQGEHGVGLITVDLRNLGTTGKITVVDASLFTQTEGRRPTIEVLGENDAATGTVLAVDGETHFVPTERHFRPAIAATRAQL